MSDKKLPIAQENEQEEKVGRWSLDALYKSLDSEAYTKDRSRALELVALYVETSETKEGKEQVKAFLDIEEELSSVLFKLFSYLALRSSVCTTDSEVLSEMARLNRQLTDYRKAAVIFGETVKALHEDPHKLAGELGFESYGYVLERVSEEAAHRLTPELEELTAKLNLSGSDMWENLYETLTSTLKAEYRGKELTLSEVRNLASNADPSVRKAAYEAELACYPKIRDSIAYCLNALKPQVKMLAKEREFASPLDEACAKSHMQRKTLDALIGAMEDHFEIFRRYLRAKATLLGDRNGLAWYNIEAPVGKIDASFDRDSAKAYLLKTFEPFNPRIAGVMRRAFEEEWIDFYPREGKVGGAFCYNLPFVGQSRVLTNFDGSFGAVDTLAHELGHAFHGEMIKAHKPLNWDYSMPVAETASTFNETHLTMHALADAGSREEKLALLESLLMNSTQTILDIYSRFTFESEVFERCDKEFLDADALCDIMIRAQKKAFGDALDETTLHPYMWLCKGHYYSASLSYYNWPYAFGSLLSMGLYKRVQADPAYMESYEKFLRNTTVMSVEDCGKSVGIDLGSRSFWEEGLAAFAKLVDEYEELAQA